MKQYAEQILSPQIYKQSEIHDETMKDMFKTESGEIKDLDLYDQRTNLQYIQNLERDYLQREKTPEEQERMNKAGFLGKKKTERSINEDRQKAFRQAMITQAQRKNVETSGNPVNGSIEQFAARTMLSLNVLSQDAMFQPDERKLLQNTAGMLGDIVRFGEKTVDKDANILKLNLVTITTMFGYVTKNLADINTMVKGKVAARADQEEAENIVRSMDALLEDSTKLSKVIVHLESRALDAHEKVNAENASIKWNELFKSTSVSENLAPTEKLEDKGAGTSVVYKLQRGEKDVFFKENTSVEAGNDYVLNNILAGYKVDEQKLSELYDDMAKCENVVYWISSAWNNVNKPRMYRSFKNHIMGFLKELGLDELATDEKVKELVNQHGKTCNAMTFSKNTAMLETGDDFTLRNIATEHLAFLFDAEDVVVKVSDVTLEKGKEKVAGFIMEAAAGITYNEFEDNFKAYVKSYRESKLDPKEKGEEPKVILTKQAMDKMFKLRLLDVIAGQADRNGGNYMLDYEPMKDSNNVLIKDVKGIDNDMSFGNSNSVNGMVGEDGEYAYSYCPRSFFESVMSVSSELLRENMANYIEPSKVNMMVDRFETLKKALIAKRDSMRKEGKDLFAFEGDYAEKSSFSIF